MFSLLDCWISFAQSIIAFCVPYKYNIFDIIFKKILILNMALCAKKSFKNKKDIKKC